MLIGGLQKSSLIDYKGNIAAVVFLQGCNFSCPYCHNPELVLPVLLNPISKNEVISFLKTRVNKLDGVVISGGEPTLHKDLPEFIQEIKELGFLIKLDTNGSNPLMLNSLIERKLIDYAAMDIKTNFDDYKTVTRREIKIEDIKESAKILTQNRTDYEFRTTVVDGLLTYENFEKINNDFKKLLSDNKTNKIKRYYLQRFQKSKHVDETYENAKTFEDEVFERVAELLKQTVEEVYVR